MEKMIARVCAPALAGIKPANMVSVSKRQYPTVHGELERLRHALGPRGICFEILCECPTRVLVLVYRSRQLERTLRDERLAPILRMFGYDPAAPLDRQLARLRERLTCEVFPHEIGVFLGYPPDDIYGFLNDSRQGVLLVGEWKVYAEADKARQLFARYNACRRGVARRLQKGDTLTDIFGAA